MAIVAGRYQRNGETETLGCLVQILLLLAAMPFVGLYLLISPHSKGLGFLLTVYDEMNSIQTNLKNTGGNRNESFA